MGVGLRYGLELGWLGLRGIIRGRGALRLGLGLGIGLGPEGGHILLNHVEELLRGLGEEIGLGLELGMNGTCSFAVGVQIRVRARVEEEGSV